MRVKRPDTKWNGVYRDPKLANSPKQYRAWIMVNSKLVQLGNFATPLEAILAADFARYLAWGPDPRKWHSGERYSPIKPPNTVPSVNLPFDRQKMLNKLARAIDGVTLANNLSAYEDVAIRLVKEAEEAGEVQITKPVNQ